MDALKAKLGGAVSKKAVIVVVIVALVVALIIVIATIASKSAKGANSGKNRGPNYGPVYRIKFAGDPGWGISEQGTMSKTLGRYHFHEGKFLLASDPTKALGAKTAPANNADAGLVSASAPHTTFNPDIGPGTKPFIFAGTNQALTRYGGVGLQEGGKLVTYQNVMPHYNQGWIVETA